MRLAVPLLCVALVGCGNSPSNNSSVESDVFAKFVAKRYDQDCRSANAPDPKAAKELDQLCSCMTEKILATVQHGDKDDVVNGKIDEHQQACMRQVYPPG